jgi:hypothetical protein
MSGQRVAMITARANVVASEVRAKIQVERSGDVSGTIMRRVLCAPMQEAACRRPVWSTCTVPEKYLNTDQAAEYVGLSRRWLELARYRGDGPSYIKLRRSVKYRPPDLDDFMASNVRAPDKPLKARAAR